MNNNYSKSIFGDLQEIQNEGNAKDIFLDNFYLTMPRYTVISTQGNMFSWKLPGSDFWQSNRPSQTYKFLECAWNKYCQRLLYGLTVLWKSMLKKLKVIITWMYWYQEIRKITQSRSKTKEQKVLITKLSPFP